MRGRFLNWKMAGDENEVATEWVVIYRLSKMAVQGIRASSDKRVIVSELQ